RFAAGLVKWYNWRHHAYPRGCRQPSPSRIVGLNLVHRASSGRRTNRPVGFSRDRSCVPHAPFQSTGPSEDQGVVGGAG
ncbi:unnamed protein product, partial [Pylaiella littoralis]